MREWKLRMVLPIAALLFAAGMNPARAQAPLEPAQMSPRTLFYMIWRGVPGGGGEEGEFAAGAVG
jgi:hypothetical protein